MDSDMLEIHPRELTFVFELLKQSADSVQLYNSSDQYVAFKVKTTSPKKYCVRPNIGIIKPKSTCTFTVTMQPPREAPPYMQCKDKFLIQSTVIPFGTKEEEITSDMFSKSSGKYIEEKKLRVVLISAAPDVIPVKGDSEKGPPERTLTQSDQALSGLDTPQSELTHKDGGLTYSTDIEASVLENDKTTKATSKPMDSNITPGKMIEEPTPETINFEKPVVSEILKETLDASCVQPAIVETNNVGIESCQNAESGEPKDLSSTPQTSVESKPVNNIDIISNEDFKVELSSTEKELPVKDKETCQNSIMDIEALKLKLGALDSQLNEAKYKIAMLSEEQTKTNKEKELLKHEMAMLKQGTDVNMGQVYDGFPLLFVCVVALVSLACGYLLRP